MAGQTNSIEFGACSDVPIGGGTIRSVPNEAPFPTPVGSDYAARGTDGDRYLDLLARSLTRYETDDVHARLDPFRRGRFVRRAWSVLDTTLDRRGLELVKKVRHDYSKRAIGADVPVSADTGIGLARLANLRECIETVISDQVPGDLLEAGVWRGGASVYMRAVLAVHQVTDRHVWLADSFAGPPVPDLDAYPKDAKIYLHKLPLMAVSLDTVRETFTRYGLLDEHVHFLQGWFKDTLPSAPIERLAVLRLDGDLYESTMQIFEALYDRVSPGGFIIVDDYLRFDECRQATDDFRKKMGIDEPWQAIDEDGVVWRKSP